MTLELQSVSLRLAGRRLFAPLSFTVPDGEIVTVMGASGSGKSSLLGFLCGTLEPGFTAEGRALLDGGDLAALPPERRGVGILFQDDLLFPHLSVGENLAFGLPSEVRGRAARRAEILGALAEAGLEGFEQRDPATLSGGQRARVALLRTLLARPRGLLLDEPFAKLDVSLRDRIRAFVFSHARARGLPTLLVTHDPDDAEAARGPVVALAAVEGGSGPASAI
ncbi:ATP-binding cassette domain-containing protein [Algihabitans albus]|uniref:ATP-binding cassette domain-containing protein n=1 Tax=Algihabitans albus TaxID=2164067 RepID=UPI000E5D6866|nr:ATP-binding cassette domain-containing protein [Algihabitans albus]